MAQKKLSYTYETAMELTGLSHSTLKRAVKGGELKTLTPRLSADRPVRKVLIDPAELERWLHNQTPPK